MVFEHYTIHFVINKNYAHNTKPYHPNPPPLNSASIQRGGSESSDNSTYTHNAYLFPVYFKTKKHQNCIGKQCVWVILEMSHN